MLQPSSKEILEAIRALFLQTHWHSFFIMSDVEASMILGGNEGAPLRDPPLVPTILPLPANNDDVFRQLAQVSKSTRGVVLLLCNLLSARRIMAQAQRLNMVGGHFIWLWADSSATTEFYDVTQPSEVELSEKLANENPEFSAAIRRESDSWYDPVGGILSHHLDDLEERRMDFDEYGVRKKQQKEKSRHLPRQFGGQILGVNIDEGVKPVRRKRNEVHEEITDQPSTESTENVDEETELNPVHNDNKDEVAASSDGVASDGSKLKRNPYLQHNSTSHVLFHHFNDFPVGFLALRPIKMAVDRHFVRSVVRLFAHTWAITELQAGSLKSDGGVLDTLTSRTRPSSRGSKRPQRRKRSSGKTREVNSSFTSRTLTNHSDLSVDLGDKLMRENTSGLNVNHTSNKSLRLNSDTKVSRSKRQNTWWSVNSTEAPPPPTPAATRPRINTTLAVEKTGRKISAPQYRAGCFGTSGKIDIRRAEHFAKILRQNTRLAMSGNFVIDGTMEKPLITHFELLNLVPNEMKLKRSPEYRTERESELPDDGSRKWRRVGLVSGTSVHLDTIVWPGGDIVVSGLSARPRSVFRVVTALAPPFVMESDLDEDGLCLRGLYCHRLSTTGSHNLTLMFNEIETRNRLVKGASEHRSHYTSQTTSQNHQNEANYKTKCCYGLSMDLLENIATELGFEFHLYIVRDEVYGTRLPPRKPWGLPKSPSALSNQMAEGTTSDKLTIEEDTSEDFEKKYRLNSNTDPNNIFGRKYQKNFFNTAGQRLDHEGEFDPVNIRSQTERHNFRVDQWNGIIGDLMAGSADMSFAALSVSKVRAEAIDFSAPYFHSGVSLLAAPKTKSDIPLLAFLLPFSPELWIAIFTSLNITAIAVAVYEWLSPFGLNPWGRQRSKNFSMSSALWVMWGLLCGHLVAFKAPKSWPNKFLINVWGGFSVIFVASYTANIAALIAGLFFHNAANKYDASLLTQRVGAPIASAAETYIQKNDKHLWEHMRKYSLQSVEDGIRGLKNGSLDLLMADSPILDYYRATDHGCNLQRIGETYVEDTYAIGMTKGFPLRDSISALIAKYSSNGYLDILTEKWYGGLPCFKLGIEIAQPRPLGVAAVAGVFLLLGLGMILGCLILIFEHWFYKYALPILRHKPKGTVWKSRNIMFFSQKLYRFINCVELVSPHHAARELVHTLRQGQIASLFQKSIKRKEDEQRRRRKSKAQFFEMIQEIRRINFLSRVQQEERETAPLPAVQEIGSNLELAAAAAHEAQSKPPKISPKPKLFSKKESRSRSNSSGLNVRRFSTDSILGERMDTIGRRLSRDISYSPPDLGHRFETFGKGLGSLSASKFDAYSSRKMSPDGKFDTFSGTRSSLPEEPEISGKKFTRGRTPLNLDVYEGRRSHDNLAEAMTPLKERLAPPICILEPESGVLRDRMHEELRQKYGGSTKSNQIRRSKSQQQDLSPSSSTTRSKNSLEVGGRSQQPTPSPRRTKRDLECTRTPKTPAKSNGKKFSLERLSREELMRLSHSSQDEIHEYLEKDIQSPEPP
ncbi:Ionotropic glutamate receptor [Sergentomyia squamirostris]